MTQDTPARPLRVVIDARMREGLYGGVQQWVIGLAKALSDLESADEEYLFLVEYGHERWLLPYLGGRSRLVRLPRRPLPRRVLGPVWRRMVRVSPSLERLRPVGASSMSPPASDGTVERTGADVVHFPMQSAFLTMVPSLYQPWDLQHLHLPEFFTDSQRAWRELTYRSFCAQASVVIAATRWVKDDLVEQYGLSPEQIAVINVPPVTAAYPIPRRDDVDRISRRLRLPERFAFYPAQTWPHKNHARLLEALSLLRDQGLTIPLVCSGHLNEHHPGIVDAVRRLGLEEDVHFVGYLEPLEVQVLYGRARALVFPSLYEGWGLPVVEAFLAGLPVACSNATSLPELVGDAALVFDPLDPGAIADATGRLWTDDNLAADLAQRGRRRLEQFSWERTAITLRALYRQVGGRTLTAQDRELLATAPLV